MYFQLRLKQTVVEFFKTTIISVWPVVDSRAADSDTTEFSFERLSEAVHFDDD